MVNVGTKIANIKGPPGPPGEPGGLTPAQQALLDASIAEMRATMGDAATGNVHAIWSTDEPEMTTVNGKRVLWLRLNPEYTQVTPSAPTFTDAGSGVTAKFTIPAVTGVTYQRDGVTVPAGVHAVAPPATVTIRAVAQVGYSLKGVRTWVHSWMPDPSAGFDLYETFTGADGSPVVGRPLFKGGLTWVATAGASLAGAEVNATITGNAVVNSSATVASLTASVSMPQPNFEATLDYDLTGRGGAGGSRVYIFVHALTGQDTLTVAIESDGRLLIYKGGGVEVVPSGNRTGHPGSGSFSVRYVDGALTVKVNGTSVATVAQTIGTGFTGTGAKAGFVARGQYSKVDNFRVVYL